MRPSAFQLPLPANNQTSASTATYQHANATAITIFAAPSGAPAVRIELVLKNDELRIDSVYTIGSRQIVKKMHEKKEWLAGRSQGGHSPGAGGIAGWFRMPPVNRH